jgi:alkylresorcinol/alkylpyrone synthase
MFLSGIGTAVPPRRFLQRECWEGALRSPAFGRLSGPARALAGRILGNPASGVEGRYLSVDSIDEAFVEDADVLQRRFERHAPALAAEAARRALSDAGLSPEEVGALVVSTCTGYLCPGLSGYVAERLGLRRDLLGLDLVGQGCAAAIPNLRTAHALLAAEPGRPVLSVCVEISSAAFYIDDDPGVLVSACLFGDGAGALVLTAAPRPGKRPVRWRRAWSDMEPAERDTLRFEHRGGKLRNVLGARVPPLAAERAAALARQALADARLSAGDVRAWLWHAGGRPILEGLARRLELPAGTTALSAGVLADCGNLSSAFVYFVLERALRGETAGGWWWMSSFGAGFACHGALLSVAD